MNEVRIRLFGAFRNMQAEPEISLCLSEDTRTVGDLRYQLETLWHEKSQTGFDVLGLLRKSAIATDSEVLPDEAPLVGSYFAILPPVSGG